MNWLDTFCFTSVARTQSFSATAREMMISQQAVSRHIKALEDELGYPLFLRNVQTVRLTRAGERMLQYFTERERLLEDFKKSAARGAESEVLRVAWTQWLGCTPALRRAVDAFRLSHPNITLLAYDLNDRELREMLQAEEIDVLLTTRYASALLPIRWRTEPLSEEPICLLSPARTAPDKAHLSFYIHMADLAGEPDEAGVRARVHRTYEKLGARPQRIDIFPEMGSVCLNLLMSGGVSFGITKPALADNPDFSLLPSGITATTLLCVPPHAGKTPADEFVQTALEVSA